MKNFVTIIFFILFINESIFSQEQFQYISPKNGAKLVSLSTNIIAGAKEKIDFSYLPQNVIRINGEKSGIHTVTIKFSDDGKTLIFVPQKQFEPNEKVDVQIFSGIRTVNGQTLLPVELTFTTTKLIKPINTGSLSIEDEDIGAGVQNTDYQLLNKNMINPISEGLPSDFPAISVKSLKNPAQGKIFITNFPSGKSTGVGFYLTIVNNDGSIAEYKKLPERAFDFKVQPNGELSYYTSSRWFVMDTSFNVIDTFQCGNGYTADLHDFELLPNGHALLFAYDPEPVDMSQITPGGNPNAIVLGGIIQELDSQKNVVFQWRSWDYIPITDSYIDLTTPTVDYLHMNAVDFDYDGNILASNRHISTVIKINRKTGEVMWRMGGKENEFVFINERDENYPNYFSFQHDIRRLPNGDVTLFDNGNQHKPNYSRAVEYKLDEINKTATLVWEYRHSPDIYCSAMGSVQRLPDGSTVIGWGLASSTGNAAVTELHPDNSIAMELFYPRPQTSYRAYKLPWKSQIASFSDTSYDVLQGNTYSFHDADDSTIVSIKLNKAIGSNANLIFSLYNYSPVKPVFNSIAPIVTDGYFTIKQENLTAYEGDVHVNLSKQFRINNPEETIIYFKGDDSTAFVPLVTSYDSLTNEFEFTSTDFGEFIFGEPQNIDTVYTPVPLTPLNGEIVNGEEPVKLHWSYRGLTRKYHLQVSNDSLFNNPVINDSEIISNFFTIDSVLNDTSYYWRVSGINLSGESNWSETSFFKTGSPFIMVSNPINKDTLFIDSTYIIRWNDNISGLVKIELIKGDVISIIADSLNSPTDAFKWTVSSSVKIDSAYKIVIASVEYPDVSDTSNQNFIVDGLSTGIKNNNEIVKDYRLYQNYPNPFNPSTIIKYDLPKMSNVTISIFNIIGQRIAVLVNRVQNSGEHEVVWNAQNAASGVYLYKIKAEDTKGKNSFVQYKKAVLIK